MSKTFLVLKKGEETKTLTLKSGSLGAAQALGPVIKVYRQGWILIDCYGDDVKTVAFMKNVLNEYGKDSKSFSLGSALKAEMFSVAGVKGFPKLDLLRKLKKKVSK